MTGRSPTTISITTFSGRSITYKHSSLSHQPLRIGLPCHMSQACSDIAAESLLCPIVCASRR